MTTNGVSVASMSTWPPCQAEVTPYHCHNVSRSPINMTPYCQHHHHSLQPATCPPDSKTKTNPSPNPCHRQLGKSPGSRPGYPGKSPSYGQALVKMVLPSVRRKAVVVPICRPRAAALLPPSHKGLLLSSHRLPAESTSSLSDISDFAPNRPGPGVRDS